MSFGAAGLPDEGAYKGVYYTWSTDGTKLLKSVNGWLKLSSKDFVDLLSGNAIPPGRPLTELFIKVESGSNIYFTFGSTPAAVVDNAFTEEFYKETVKVRRYEAYSFELSGLTYKSINLHSIGTSYVRIVATFE